MLLWGSSAYCAALIPQPLAQSIARRLRHLSVGLIIIATVTTAATLALQSGMIGEGWRDTHNVAMIHDVLMDTSVGQAWQAEAVGALLLLMALVVPFAAFPAATAVASGLFLASFALTGHAAMYEGWLRPVHGANDALHLLSAGAWVGALAPLLIVLRGIGQADHHTAADRALRRFSTAGHLAVALMLASGVANTFLVLRQWPIDLSSPYVVMLDLKIALVAAMLALALANRYFYTPRLAQDQAASIRALRRDTAIELLLGIMVIALVSVFGMLEPPGMN